MSGISRKKALERARRLVEKYSESSGYPLYPDRVKVDSIILGLAENIVSHDKPYCPCRPVESSAQNGTRDICPCESHKEDIKRDGYCECGLFVRPGFISG